MSKSDALAQISDLLGSTRATNALVVGVGPQVPETAGLPSWSEIASMLILDLSRVIESSDELVAFKKRALPYEIAELYVSMFGIAGLQTTVQRFVSERNPHPSPLYQALSRLPVRAFVTTNMDSLLEQALARRGISPQVVANASDLPTTTEHRPLIFKLRGSWDRPATIKLDPSRLGSGGLKDAPVDTYLAQLLSATPVLFVGYSVHDSEFQRLYQTYYESGSRWSNWVVLTEDTDEVTENLWRFRGVRIIEIGAYSLEQVLTDFRREIRRPNDSNVLKHGKNYVLISGAFHDQVSVFELQSLISSVGVEPFAPRDLPSMGRTLFESFQNQADQALGAIFLFPRRKPELFASRDRERDSALFELGLLLGRLGPSRVLIIVDEADEIPGDLLGVTFLRRKEGEKLPNGFVIQWLNRLTTGQL
jgi:hypothetical protein